MASWKRIGASLLCVALVGPAAAQPGGKVMRIVVPFAAGGAREVLARTFYSELGVALGQTAIIGANPPYDPIRDFAGVANIGMQSYVLMASAAVPAKTVAELLEYARANPGKLNYASAGHGSSSHLAMAYFASLAGLDMMHIPFKSTADANNDVLAARSHAAIVPNVGAIPFVKDERIRLLGVTSQRRSAFLPGVPPVAESVPGYRFDSWFGLLAPAMTPKPVIARINAAMAKLLRDPVILARLAGQGVEPRPLSPAAFERVIREDYEDMARVVRAVGRFE